jgi:hypothetical protein
LQDASFPSKIAAVKAVVQQAVRIVPIAYSDQLIYEQEFAGKFTGDEWFPASMMRPLSWK